MSERTPDGQTDQDLLLPDGCPAKSPSYSPTIIHTSLGERAHTRCGKSGEAEVRLKTPGRSA